MSSRTISLSLAGLFGTALLWFLSGLTQAQEKPDLLKDAAARQKIAVEQLEKEFTDVTGEARKLAAQKEPAKAIVMLETLREKLAADTLLPKDNREAKFRRINVMLIGLNGAVVDLANPSIPASVVGRTREKQTDDKARQVADEAKQQQQRVARAKTQDEYIKDQQRQGYLAVTLENEKAHIMQTEDMTFPADWKEKSLKRSQINMTPEEKKLVKALNSPVDIDMPESTLEAVIEYLKDKTGVVINVPNSALEDRAITYKTPVSVKLKGVTMRTVLKKVLGDVGLTYVVEKGTILATTEERAKTMLTTRSYYLGDFASLQAIRFGPALARLQMISAVNDMIGVIVGTVEPNSWWLNGGNGTIAFDPASMSLIIRQTSEIHYMLGGIGAGGR